MLYTILTVAPITNPPTVPTTPPTTVPTGPPTAVPTAPQIYCPAACPAAPATKIPPTSIPTAATISSISSPFFVNYSYCSKDIVTTVYTLVTVPTTFPNVPVTLATLVDLVIFESLILFNLSKSTFILSTFTFPN